MTQVRLAGDAENLRLNALPDDNQIRRIAWFGPVQFSDRTRKTDQPSVLVYMSVVRDPAVLENPDLPVFPDLGNSRLSKFWLSVGQIVLLRIGDLWLGRRFFHRPTGLQATFEKVSVDLSHVTSVKAGASLDNGHFLIPFEEHIWHSENTHSYCTRVKLPDGRFLVIPAVELIRFYFGSSAKLLSLLFKPNLSTDDLFERVAITPVNQWMTLDLAEGIPRASATDVARIAGDKQAWAAAQYVGTSCLKASVARQDVYPSARFPFTGKTTLQVCGQWLSRGDELRGTFLVYSILSCSHSFPFKRLVYQLKNEASRARGPNGQQAGDVQTRNRAGGSKLPSKPGLEEDDASSGLAPHGYQFRGGRNFPYLAGKFVRAVSKVEPAGATTSTSSSQAVEQLGVGASGTSARRREALLEDVDQGRSREIPGFLKAAVAGLNSLEETEIQLLTGGSSDGWTLDICLMLDEGGDIDERLFIQDAEGPRPRRFAAFLISRGTDRLIAVFTESDPMCPLIYPAERGDVEEVHATMECAARDFLRRLDGDASPGLAVGEADQRGAEAIKEWVAAFF